MARRNNYLLGKGERLTAPVEVPSGGAPKNPPYTFASAKRRLSKKLSETVNAMSSLPAAACPRDEAVAILTLHPRYIAKSDFPRDLLEQVGVRAVGSRLRMIEPEQWGTTKHPPQAMGQDIFVAGPRANFRRWTTELPTWSESTRGADKLAQVEDIRPFAAGDKVRRMPTDRARHVFEVVLHNGGDEEILRAFERYALRLGAEPLMERRRDVKGLSFVPVTSTAPGIIDLATFAFVRVTRSMPTLRPLVPSILRKTIGPRVSLPEGGPLDPSSRVLIFDGGLPRLPDLSNWVSLIEPENIGPSVPALEEHGLAVTSAFLFGSMQPPDDPGQPLCHVDHVRVLDASTGMNDLEYVDVLDRILEVLQQDEGEHEFVNISLGPDVACLDDEVSLWTAALDEHLVEPARLVTVAAGNDGELDSDLGLNRIQPPADGVNVLSVGAATSREDDWQRAAYSCTGPGRTPGIVKPDGVSFGGSDDEPFMVLGASSAPRAVGVKGTSFSAPYALRAGVSVRVQLGNELNPLAVRALLVHQADCRDSCRREVGWGRFPDNFGDLITCNDNEVLVVYQGSLPVGQSLRAPFPLPKEALQGMVTLQATLLIAPRVDPEHPGAYTQSGVEVSFRPHSDKYRHYADGRTSAHPTTAPFFSERNMYSAAEYELREDGQKWEPCLKSSKAVRASSLKDPCFDIAYQHRQGLQAAAEPEELPYALVIGLRANKVPDLYNRVVRAYPSILVPLRPRLRIGLTS
ncbi:MAG TPA: S8 family peptidase [Thermoanaerobaculia bacterium]|nr:S8 family peptidase [Thermoanaerobaculia bacterium]